MKAKVEHRHSGNHQLPFAVFSCKAQIDHEFITSPGVNFSRPRELFQISSAD